MKLYEFPSSPHCLKVRAVAYELGVELELARVNILKSGSRRASFLALNPNGLVPVLVDGDFVLWESNAIVTYLASTHPSPTLLPRAPRERADVDRWLHWQSAHLGPAIARLAFERFVKPMTAQGPVNHGAAARAAGDFAAHCRTLETSLRGKEYVASRLSVADFALALTLNSAAMMGLGVGTLPWTKAWLRRMLTRESVKSALAEAQIRISDMYPTNGGTNGAHGRRLA